MADTPRTRAQILALLADNTTGEISPQDMRDFVVSIWGVYGVIVAVNNAVVQALVAATPAKLTKYTKNGLGVGSTPDYQNGEIVIDNTGVYEIFGSVSGKIAASNTLIHFHLGIDGAAADAGTHMRFANSSEEYSGSFMDQLLLNAGQKLSIIAVSDKSGDYTLIDGQLVVRRIG